MALGLRIVSPRHRHVAVVGVLLIAGIAIFLVVLVLLALLATTPRARDARGRFLLVVVALAMRSREGSAETKPRIVSDPP